MRRVSPGRLEGCKAFSVFGRRSRSFTLSEASSNMEVGGAGQGLAILGVVEAFASGFVEGHKLSERSACAMCYEDPTPVIPHSSGAIGDCAPFSAPCIVHAFGGRVVVGGVAVPT